MKIHPEMREIVEKEMQEGLQYWRDKSPEQILKAIHDRMIAEQKPLQNLKTHDLGWEYVMSCKCLMHGPWCQPPKPVIRSYARNVEINGRIWMSGHSPWGMI